MTLARLLIELACRDIRLYLSGNALKFKARKGSVTDDLLTALREYKNECISVVRNRPATVLHSFPMSNNQQSLWFIHRVAPLSAAYNIGLAVHILSPVSTEALRQAIIQLSVRHSILRTTYAELAECEIPCQHIHDSLGPEVKLMSCPGVTDWSLREMVRQQYARPFDLSAGPMVRCCLFTRGDEDHVLLLTLHHISADGWSFKTLLADLADEYKRISCGSDGSNKGKPEEYAHFVAYQYDLLHNPAVDNLSNYWQKVLRDAPSLSTLPADRIRPRIERYEGKSHAFSITGEDYRKIGDRARTDGVTVASVLHAAYMSVLRRFSGAGDFVTGIPTAGSQRSRWHSTVGYCVNPMPVRIVQKENDSLIDGARFVQNVIRDGLSYQDYPFALLCQKIKIERISGAHPVFQTLFNLLPRSLLGFGCEFLYGYDNHTELEWAGLRIRPWGIDQQNGNFDLNLEICDTGSIYHCVLKYRTDLFDDDTTALLAAQFRETLLAFARSSDRIDVKNGNRTITIAATFTAEPIGPVIDFWRRRFMLPGKTVFAPFNHVFQQLLDPGSDLRTTREGSSVCLVRFDDWLEKKETGIDGMLSALKVAAVEFESAVRTAAQPLIIVICKPAEALFMDPVLNRALQELCHDISVRLQSIAGCSAIGWHEVDERYPVDSYELAGFERLGHLPYTDVAFAALGTMVMRTIIARNRRPYKVVVADCDNTLWNGILGEDGLAGITVDENRKTLQKVLVDCTEKGMLLCLCSKNDEKEVMELLRSHPDMVIRPEHLSGHRINWEPKSRNIIDMARELNLGLDSFIVFDDNPVEIAEIGSGAPQVLGVLLPKESDLALHTALHCWALDAAPATGQDRNRTEQYRQEAQRSSARSNAASLAEFIKGLNMHTDIKPAQKGDVARISELTMRTNQFNIFPSPRTEADILALLQQPRVQVLTVRVSDRFGDYGLVGVCILRQGPLEVNVDTFMLSCRALGRGVEHLMLAACGDIALKLDVPMLTVRCMPTDRNQPALDFMEKAGKSWRVSTESFPVYKIPSQEASSVIFEPSNIEASPVTSAGISPARESNNRLVERLNELQVMKKFDTADLIASAISGMLRNRQPLKSLIASKHVSENMSVTQKIIAQIWQETISINGVGIDCNFFDAGGTSIRMPVIAARIKELTGVDIALVDLFANTTIRQIAAFLDRKRQGLQMDDRPDAQAESAAKQRASLQKQRNLMAAARKNG